MNRGSASVFCLIEFTWQCPILTLSFPLNGKTIKYFLREIFNHLNVVVTILA